MSKFNFPDYIRIKKSGGVLVRNDGKKFSLVKYKGDSFIGAKKDIVDTIIIHTGDYIGKYDCKTADWVESNLSEWEAVNGE